MTVYIIAEAGVNHNGDILTARKMITEASKAGVDAIKFQTFKAGKLATKRAQKAHYQMRHTDKSETHFEMLQALEISHDFHKVLINECKEAGIEFLSSAFDCESLEMLVDLGMKKIKIPSGELTNLPLVRKCASMRLPIMLSTGMSGLTEVEGAVEVIEGLHGGRSKIALLHCNTEYPTPMSDVNLAAMLTLKQAFGVQVGYSDHTMGIEVPIASVALGASIIEKHFTLDRAMPGPDHQASLLPHELRSMTNAIRNIEVALGDGIKRVTASERDNLQLARKSLVASKPIKAGELFGSHNMAAKRPANGITPMRWDEFVGRVAGKDYEEDDLIEY